MPPAVVPLLHQVDEVKPVPSVPRSSRHDVRNPMIAIPEVIDFCKLPPEALEAMRVALLAISKTARVKAEALWSSHHAVMAMYWKAKATLNKPS